MKEKETMYCQSCGMPMQQPTDFGTETDGNPNSDYCAHCFKDGAFTADCTMEEMIQFCAQFHEAFKTPDGRSYTREEAIAEMQRFFPLLKRWKQ